MLVDLLGAEPLDILQDKTYDSLLRLAFSGLVRCAHASHPCRDCSRLKLRPGGPPAIRTPEYLDGVPSNNPAQQVWVLSSQKMLYRCTCILRAAFSAGAHISLEQPTNAMSWLEPFTQDLLSEVQASLCPLAQWARTLQNLGCSLAASQNSAAWQADAPMGQAILLLRGYVMKRATSSHS